MRKKGREAEEGGREGRRQGGRQRGREREMDALSMFPYLETPFLSFVTFVTFVQVV